MDKRGDFRTKWAASAVVVLVCFAWASVEIAVEPRGEDDFLDPLLFQLMVSVPPGVAMAGIFARFGHQTLVLATIAGCGYGAWLALVATSSGFVGELFYCDEAGDVPCYTSWQPRLATLAIALLVLAACAFLESRLRSRWAANAPS